MLSRHNSGFLELGDAAVPYELRRSHRRRTLGLTVTPQQVRIHAPNWTPRAEIEHYVRAQQKWLQRAWARMQTRVAVIPEAGQPRGTVLYLGRELTLAFHVSLFVEIKRRGQTLHLYAPEQNAVAGLLRAWLRERASRFLAWRLARLARRLGRAPTRFALSDAQTQWGSCTRSGRIRLNWRLMQAPLALIDYVAAHELAHLIHLDHSAAFWAQVATLCPDAMARRAALRKMSLALFQI